jgi:hypothetical protein
MGGHIDEYEHSVNRKKQSTRAAYRFIEDACGGAARSNASALGTDDIGDGDNGITID